MIPYPLFILFPIPNFKRNLSKPNGFAFLYPADYIHNVSRRNLIQDLTLRTGKTSFYFFAYFPLLREKLMNEIGK